MSHLDEGTLHALIDGEISSAELAPITAHLSQCEVCRNRLDEERLLTETATELVDGLEVPPAHAPAVVAPVRRPGATPRQLAWAATIVLAAGLGFSVRGLLTTSPVAPPQSLLEEQVSPARDATLKTEASVPDSTAPAAAPLGSVGIPEDVAAPAPAPLAALGSEVRQAERKAQTDAISRDAQESPAAAPAEPATPRPVLRTDSAPSISIGRAREEDPRSSGLRASRPAAQARGVASNQRGGGPIADSMTFRLDEIVPTAVIAGRIDTIPLADAERRLAGRMRTLRGLTPEHVLLEGETVRIVYRVGGRPVVLQQHLAADSVVVVLLPPAGMSFEAVEALRARIQ